MIKLINQSIICDRCEGTDETGFFIDGKCVCNNCVTERELNTFKIKPHSRLQILLGVLLIGLAMLFLVKGNWLLGIADIILGMVCINFGIGEQ